MEWRDWEPTWRRIQADFGYPPEADLDAARLLRSLVPATNRLAEAAPALGGRAGVVVAGCGPGLEGAPRSAFAGRAVVAADGATERLRELGVVPALVVSDLDGDPEALRWAAGAGSWMVVHAHGDNRDAVQGIAPLLGVRVVGTHQVEPQPGLEPLANLGGFTDGDRAVVLCEAMGVPRVTLVGFEYDAEPSRYSHAWDSATKRRKLAWARRIVEEVAVRGRTRIEAWRPPA